MPIAELAAALGEVKRVFLDSSTLIAFHNNRETVHALARYVLGRIESDQDPLHGYYSVISATEILVRPIRAGGNSLAYIHTFVRTFPHLTVLPVDLFVALESASFRASTGIALPDATIIACGLLAGCEAIITNDARWHRRLAPLFRNFRWIYLGEFL